MNKYGLQLLKLFFSISRIFPSNIAIKTSEKLFTTPLILERRELEKKLLDTADKFTVSQGKNSISAYRWGEKTAPIILFVHGWSSSGTCFIKFIKPFLSEGYQVISYDAIAHGDTKGAKSASITQWADGLIAVIKEIGDIHCIIGHSLGAGSVVVANSLSLKVNKLILISPLTNIIKQTEQFAKIFSIPKNLLIRMQDYAWDKYQDSSLKYGRNWQEIFEAPIEVPTLIIHDVDDTEVDIDCTKKLVKRVKDVSYIETEKLGHRRILLNPRIIRTCIRFITEE